MSDGERRDGGMIDGERSRWREFSQRVAFPTAVKKHFHQGSVFLKLAKKTSTREVFF